jgi:hypothetical protein
MFRTITIAIAVLTSMTAFAQTIERPSVKIGDECRYDVFDNLRKDDQGNPEKIAETRRVVTAVEGDRVTTNVTRTVLVSRDTEDLGDGTEVLNLDLNLVERNGRKYDPAYPSRLYPLTPGAEKKDAITKFQRQQGDGDTDLKVDGKASNWQKVVVPAGSFDVITITWSGWYNTTRGSNRWSGKSYWEVTLSPTSWCQVSGVYKQYRGNGGIWSDRTFKLTGLKN